MILDYVLQLPQLEKSVVTIKIKEKIGKRNVDIIQDEDLYIYLVSTFFLFKVEAQSLTLFFNQRFKKNLLIRFSFTENKWIKIY